MDEHQQFEQKKTTKPRNSAKSINGHSSSEQKKKPHQSRQSRASESFPAFPAQDSSGSIWPQNTPYGSVRTLQSVGNPTEHSRSNASTVTHTDFERPQASVQMPSGSIRSHVSGAIPSQSRRPQASGAIPTGSVWSPNSTANPTGSMRLPTQGQMPNQSAVSASGAMSSRSGNTISIVVMDLNDRAYRLQVEPSTTVRSIKNKLQSKYGIDPNNCQLLFGGVRLDDESPLMSYGIRDGSVIQMAATYLGGKSN